MSASVEDDENKIFFSAKFDRHLDTYKASFITQSKKIILPITKYIDILNVRECLEK